METKTEEQILDVIIRNCIIIFVIMVVLAFIMAVLSNKAIFKPLEEFQDGLINFFKYLNIFQKDEGYEYFRAQLLVKRQFSSL